MIFIDNISEKFFEFLTKNFQFDIKNIKRGVFFVK
jgi:hypothetical protein